MPNNYSEVLTENSEAVAHYAFCAPDSVEGKDRDIEITVFGDRTCLWEDVQGRLTIRKDKFLPIKSLLGDTASSIALEQERTALTFESKIGDDAYVLLLEKESLSADEIATATDLCERLDHVLAPYFWRDINAKLNRPLIQLGAAELTP